MQLPVQSVVLKSQVIDKYLLRVFLYSEFFQIFLFNWSIVDLQRFCWTAKWFSYIRIYTHTHTHTSFFKILFLIMVYCRALGLQWLWCMDSVNCSSQALEHRLCSCSAWAQLLHGTWDLPRSGIEQTCVSCTGGRILCRWTTREALSLLPDE